MPSSQSPLDQPKVLKALTKRIEANKYTPTEIAGWVEDKFGITTTTDSLRRFRQRHGINQQAVQKTEDTSSESQTTIADETPDVPTYTHSILKTDDGETCITVLVSGDVPKFATDDHPNFEEILAGVESGDPDVVDLFDPERAVSTRFEKITERVSVKDGKIYFDGDELKNTATEHILRCLKEGEDFLPVVNFLEKVSINPNQESANMLWDWLQACDGFTIAPDGDVVGYKGVEDDLTSQHAGGGIVDGVEVEGNIPNNFGSTIELPRSQVTFDPDNACAQGLHIGTYQYAKNWASKVIEVRFNPRDVVSVPKHDHKKLRVCRYTVVRELIKGYEAPILNDSDPEDDCAHCGYFYDEAGVSCCECGKISTQTDLENE